MKESEKLQLGRLQTQAVLGTLAVLIIAPAVVYLTHFGSERLPQQALTVLASLLLLWNVYRGYGWARNITVALAIVAGIGGVLASLFVGTTAGWLLLIVGLLFIGCGMAFVASQSIAAFLAAQREARTRRP
ncbi:hypothetical protein HNR42_000761 [Deinobacterium chartae]|uniref:SPW repeat-containing protein n=1 Tax=Deinobacterium chartae TaxID=521158 RepID=A0A841HVE0_9DEIO|nr:hypothetical protein [Deinobacterium chartae]MBB6097347.1 hypothetical protein [Deinobacterium chartae]